MAKLDGLKELLNTLRIAFSVIVLIIIALTSGLVNRYDKGLIDVVFYGGAMFDLIFISSLAFILKKIAKVTKEVKYTKE